MRIRYTKPGGKEVDLPDGAARRLIASGQAEAVTADEPQPEAADEPSAPRRASAGHKAAAKKTRRSR